MPCPAPAQPRQAHLAYQPHSPTPLPPSNSAGRGHRGGARSGGGTGCSRCCVQRAAAALTPHIPALHKPRTSPATPCLPNTLTSLHRTVLAGHGTAAGPAAAHAPAAGAAWTIGNDGVLVRVLPPKEATGLRTRSPATWSSVTVDEVQSAAAEEHAEAGAAGAFCPEPQQHWLKAAQTFPAPNLHCHTLRAKQTQPHPSLPRSSMAGHNTEETPAATRRHAGTL